MTAAKSQTAFDPKERASVEAIELFEAAVRRRARVGRIVLTIIGGVLICAGIVVCLIVYAVYSGAQLSETFINMAGKFLAGVNFGSNTRWEDMHSSTLEDFLAVLPILTYGYLVFFVLPVFVSLPIIVPFSIKWRDQRRILVFRRFNVRFEHRVLRRILTRHLAPFGHVFTLADRRITIPWNVRIPLIIGQLSFFHFRPRQICDESGVNTLRRLLAQRWWLNINWFVSWRKVFALRSSDDYWQSCVQVLLDGADLAIIDLTNPSDALYWEIEEACRRVSAERVVFLAELGKWEESALWIKKRADLSIQLHEIPVWFYSESGLDNREGLRTHLLSMLSKARQKSPRPSWFEVTVATARAQLVSWCIAVTVLLALAPYVLPDLTARYSPFRLQVVHAYIYSRSGAALARLEKDFPRYATPVLVEYLQHPRSRYVQERALTGLGQIGDERAITPLVEYQEGRQDALSILIELTKRLGCSAVPALLTAMAKVSQMPFDKELYDAIQACTKETDWPRLLYLIESPNQGGRFVAALQTASLQDPRAIPIFLEMIRWDNPKDNKFVRLLSALPSIGKMLHGIPLEEKDKQNDQDEVEAWLEDRARQHLDAFLEMSNVQVKRDWLAPYIVGSDNATRYAVRFALSYLDEKDLATFVQSARQAEGYEGRMFLTYLELVCQKSQKARKILAAANEECR